MPNTENRKNSNKKPTLQEHSQTVIIPQLTPEMLEQARRAAELDALKPGTPQWEEAKREAVRRLPFFRIGDDNLIAEWKGLLKQPWGFEGVPFRFPASPGAYAVYDRYGNEIAPQGGGYVLDLGNVSHFVRPLRAGGAAEMDNALRQGQLEGMTPVELKAYDFLDPVRCGGCRYTIC